MTMRSLSSLVPVCIDRPTVLQGPLDPSVRDLLAFFFVIGLSRGVKARSIIVLIGGAPQERRVWLSAMTSRIAAAREMLLASRGERWP
jgi:hypothetical protein